MWEIPWITVRIFVYMNKVITLTGSFPVGEDGLTAGIKRQRKKFDEALLFIENVKAQSFLHEKHEEIGHGFYRYSCTYEVEWED